jgi:Fe-S-cluster-containing hydrogenase component 2
MCNFCGKTCAFGDLELLDARAIAEREGIELQGDEGHPFHCAQRMQTKSGIAGVDYARCEACGLCIYRPVSPHMGSRLNQEQTENHWGAWISCRVGGAE